MVDYNIEIKARCSNLDEVRKILQSSSAEFKGKDRQIDSYFNVNHGRLKLREGDIENALIQYDRDDKEDPKLSEFLLYKSTNNQLLKELLTKALGVLVVIDKEREIYYLDSVKIHLDNVKNLGTFVEIEANGNAEDDDEMLNMMKECKYYLKLLRISDDDLIAFSYSDMMLDLVQEEAAV